MNSRRFGAVFAVAIVLGLLGRAGAQDEAGQTGAKDATTQAGAKDTADQAGAKDTAGQTPEKDTASQGADICKTPLCPRMVGAWLKDLKACEVKTARIKELDDEVGRLKSEGQESAGLQSRLDTCSAAGTEAEKRAKEATDLADRLKKDLDELMRISASAGGEPQKLWEAVRRANAWKAEADRIKAASEAARKEAADLKVETEAARKEVSELKVKVATLEALKGDPSRGVTRIDTIPDDKPSDTATKTPDGNADPTALSDLELKNKKLQEMLEDTRRVLTEKEKEKEVSEGAIRQVLTDLVDLLGRTFECASFSVETRSGARVLKGTVAESRHRDDAWKMVLDSPLARLVHSSEIDVTAASSQVCFVKTREPGWLIARSRDKADQGAALFLRFSLDTNVIPLLPRAGDHSECEKLGAVIKSLEPLEPRPSELAVWVRGSNDAVTQCYASPDGWKLRYRVPDRDGKWPAWILVPETQPGGGVRP
jgi:hypothetical protein